MTKKPQTDYFWNIEGIYFLGICFQKLHKKVFTKVKNKKTNQHYCYESFQSLIYESSPSQAPMSDAASPPMYIPLAIPAWALCSRKSITKLQPSPGVCCALWPWWQTTTSLNHPKLRCPRGTSQSRHSVMWPDVSQGMKRQSKFLLVQFKRFSIQNDCWSTKRETQTLCISPFLSELRSICSKGLCDFLWSPESPFQSHAVLEYKLQLFQKHVFCSKMLTKTQLNSQFAN